MKNLNNLIEHHAHQLYILGKKAGYHKITDKTKWREPIMAGKLCHKAFDKISAGKNSSKYGADAINESTGIMAEYKSSAIEDRQLKNLFQKIKNPKKSTKYSALKIGGVYNGAYSHEAIDVYEKHEHYFGVFYEEKCILIIRPWTDVVISQLRANLDKRLINNKRGSSNLNTVIISLEDIHLYTVAYRDEEWFKDNG